MPGLSSAKALSLVEAAEVCLAHQGHQSPTHLKGHGGALTVSHELEFRPPTQQLLRTHADIQDATEDGAVAIAVAVVREVTSYEVVERAVKGTGIDYWLGHQPGNFAARLEVSGILTGSDKAVQARMKGKLDQMKRSDEGGLPGFGAVVEFSGPSMMLEEK